MAILDDIREFSPGCVFGRRDETTLYWIRDATLLYCGSPVKGADIRSFRFYLGGFGKDQKHCYCASTRRNGGRVATVRGLNYTYATDGNFVWTLGGKLSSDPRGRLRKLRGRAPWP